MSTWSPAKLPKARDQTAAHLLDTSSQLRRHGWPGDQDSHIDEIGRSLAVADMFWVTPDMSALAVSAAAALDDVRWTVADRPAVFGLLVWDGGVHNVRWSPSYTVPMPAAAVSWAPHPSGLLVTLWVTRQYLQSLGGAFRAGMDLLAVPPLVPAVADVLPISDQPTAYADLAGREDDPVAQTMPVVYATWQLMQQRGLAERRRADVDRKIAKAYTRRNEPLPEVTIVTLRRRYIPSQDEPAPAEEPAGRQYSHRWVVEGFWRNQRYGKGLTQVRKRWIAAFVKGPAGAPLIVKTRVNVWRR